MDDNGIARTTPINVDLWLWQYEPTTADDLAVLLSNLEREKAKKFINPEHSAKYIFAHARKRQVLATYCNIPAQELVFDLNGYGKPSLMHGPHFNLSHSGDIVALAVCTDCPIGVDVEKYRSFDQGIITRFFSKYEQRALSSYSGTDLSVAFFRVWTRKEATIKALGFGLSMPLDCFDVSAGHKAKILHIDPTYGAAADWNLIHFDLSQGSCGALAIHSRGKDINIKLCADGLNSKLTLQHVQKRAT